MRVPNTLTAEIRAALARKGTTTAEIARAIDKSQATASRKLNGQIPITLDELAEIAEYLDVSLASLLPADKASA